MHFSFSRMFQMLRGLEETSTWGNNDETFNVRNMHLHGGPESVQKHSTFSESNAASHLINFNNARGKNVHGDAISRPKSAAPQLNPNSCPDRSTHSLFPSQNEKHKPAASPSDSLFQTFDVMKIGARRSASTGLIGGNQSSSSSSAMDALGLVHEFPSNRKPQTFMDLIQEDVLPKEPTPPEFSSRTKEPEVLDAVNGSSSHGYSAQPNGIHGPTMGSIQSVPVNNYSNRDYGQNSHQNYDHMQQVCTKHVEHSYRRKIWFSLSNTCSFPRRIKSKMVATEEWKQLEHLILSSTKTTCISSILIYLQYNINKHNKTYLSRYKVHNITIQCKEIIFLYTHKILLCTLTLK